MVLLISGNAQVISIVSGYCSTFGLNLKVYSDPNVYGKSLRSPEGDVEIIICDCKDESAGLEDFRHVLTHLRNENVPILLITRWRELLFDSDNFIHRLRGPFSVLFKPIREPDVVSELERLMICSKIAGD